MPLTRSERERYKKIDRGNARALREQARRCNDRLRAETDLLKEARTLALALRRLAEFKLHVMTFEFNLGRKIGKALGLKILG